VLEVRKKTSIRSVAVAVLVAAATAAFAAPARGELWGVEPRAGSPLAKQARLAELRRKGITAVVIDAGRGSARERRRLQGAARRARLPIVFLRKAARCRTARATCAVRAPGKRSARRLVRRPAGGPVALRLRGPAELQRVAKWGGRRRLLAVVALDGSRRFDARRWRRAVTLARASRLDLVVRPVRDGGGRKLRRYLALLPKSGRRPPTRPVRPPDAPGPFDAPASVFVSPSGDDGGSCAAAEPCRSFDRAYRVAEPGQVVEIAAGTYPSQWVRKDSRKTGGPVVLFRPAAGARVVVSTDLDVEGAYIEFRGITLQENWYARPGADHLTFRNVHAQRLQVASASDVHAIGGDYGPSVDAVSQIKAADGVGSPPRDILLEGVRLHDYTRTSSENHMECLHVMAGDGITVRNSRFDDCSIFGISFNEHGDTGGMRRILVENNWFGEVLDGGAYAVHFSSGAPCEAVVRFNTFQHEGVSQECPEAGDGVTISSNILPSSPSGGADNGYRWDHNVYQRGDAIGPHDVVARVEFRDPAGFDLGITPGSAADGRGDPTAFPRTDIDGQVRSAPPDAGADEIP
jgi:hypothetical protein